MTEPGEVTPTVYSTVGTPSPAVANPTRWRQWTSLAIKIGIAIALVAWLSRSGQLNLAALLELEPSTALAALFVLSIFSLGLPAVRWWWLLRIQNLPISIADSFRLTWLSYLSALVLPGAAGGDAVKAYLVIRGRSDGRIRAISTVIVDRLLGLYSLTFLAIVPVTWWWLKGTLTAGAVALASTTLLLWLIGTAAILLMAWPATRRLMMIFFPSSWREAFDQSWLLYAQDLPGMTGCFALSFAIDVAAVLSFAAAAEALSLPASWLASFLAGPLAVISNGIPLTPGGTGVGEAASGQLFDALEIQGGAESMLLIRVVCLVCTLPAIALRWRGAE